MVQCWNGLPVREVDFSADIGKFPIFDLFTLAVPAVLLFTSGSLSLSLSLSRSLHYTQTVSFLSKMFNNLDVSLYFIRTLALFPFIYLQQSLGQSVHVGSCMEREVPVVVLTITVDMTINLFAARQHLPERVWYVPPSLLLLLLLP